MWAQRIAYVVQTYHAGNATACAHRIGVTPQTVTRILRGGAPSADTLAAIILAYPRLSPDWLLTGRGPREREALAGGAAGAVREALGVVQAAVDDARRRWGV